MDFTTSGIYIPGVVAGNIILDSKQTSLKTAFDGTCDNSVLRLFQV